MLLDDVTIMTIENSQLKTSQSATLTDSSSSNSGSVNANGASDSPVKSENGVSNDTNLTSVELGALQSSTVKALEESDKLHAPLQTDDNQKGMAGKQPKVEVECMADGAVSPTNNEVVGNTRANEHLPFTVFESCEADPEAEVEVTSTHSDDVHPSMPNVNADEVSSLNANADGMSNGNVEGVTELDRISCSNANADIGNVNADRIECIVEPPLPPDGGYGWVIVAACITQNMIVDGVCFSFAAQLEPLRRTFSESGVRTQQLALVGSLVIGLYLFLGPFCGLLANRFGCRCVTVCGSLIASLAFVLTWATCPQGCALPNGTSVAGGTSDGAQPAVPGCTCSVDVLVLTYGILVGVGFSMLYVPAIMIIGCYFERRRMLASGIAVVGSGIGITLGAPLVRFIIAQLGGDWHRAQLVLAGIVLLCAAAGLCFRPLPSRIRHDLVVHDRDNDYEHDDMEADRTEVEQMDVDLERDGYAFMPNGCDQCACTECAECGAPCATESERARLVHARRPRACGHLCTAAANHRVAIVIKRSHIMQKIIEDKQRQRTVSNGSLDNCLITVKNELIKAPPSDEPRRTLSQHRPSSLISDSLSQRLCSLLAGSTRPPRPGAALGVGSRAKVNVNPQTANGPLCNGVAPTLDQTTQLPAQPQPPTLILSTPSRRASSITTATVGGTPHRIATLSSATNRSVPTSRQASPGSSTLSVHTIDPAGSSNCAAPSPSRAGISIGRMLPLNATTTQYESIKSTMITQAVRELDKPLRCDMFLNSRARLPSLANVNELTTTATATVTDSGCSTLNTNQQLAVSAACQPSAGTVRANQHSPSPAATKNRPTAAEIYARGNAVPSQTICILSEDSIPHRRTGFHIPLVEWVNRTAYFVHVRLRDTIDVTLLRRSWMGLLVVATVLTSLGFFVPFMFVVDAASRLEKQIAPLRDTMNPVYLLSCVGLANTIGRVCTVWMTSVPWLDCFIINIVALLLAGVAAIAIPFCSSLEMLIICVCGYGICIAVFVALQSSVILELLDDSAHRLNGALGVVLLFEGVSMMIGCCVAGHYYDTTGNYRQSFMFAGIVIFISGCLCMPLRHLAKRAHMRERRHVQARTRSRSPPTVREGEEHRPIHEREISSGHDEEQQETSFATPPQRDATAEETAVQSDRQGSRRTSAERESLSNAVAVPHDAMHERLDDEHHAELQPLTGAAQRSKVDGDTQSLGFAVTNDC